MAPTNKFTLTSAAFKHGLSIPAKYTRCHGNDISPPLSWHFNDDNNTIKSLALIVDDPDAPDPIKPKMTWVHWVIYNIPPTCTGLIEGAANTNQLPPGTRVCNKFSVELFVLNLKLLDFVLFIFVYFVCFFFFLLYALL